MLPCTCHADHVAVQGYEFRPVFKTVASLWRGTKAPLQSDAPFLCATATLPAAYRPLVFKSMCMRNPVVIENLAVRTELCWTVHLLPPGIGAKRNGMSSFARCEWVCTNFVRCAASTRMTAMRQHLAPLIQEQLVAHLRDAQGQDALMIFFDHVSEPGHLMRVLIDAFPQALKAKLRDFVRIDHGRMGADYRGRVCELWSKGKLAVLLCTKAYTMVRSAAALHIRQGTFVCVRQGLNHPRVRRVVFWGCPDFLTTMLQFAGRAGRDGASANVVVFLDSVSFRSRCGSSVRSFAAVERSQALQGPMLSEAQATVIALGDSAIVAAAGVAVRDRCIRETVNLSAGSTEAELAASRAPGGACCGNCHWLQMSGDAQYPFAEPLEVYLCVSVVALLGLARAHTVPGHAAELLHWLTGGKWRKDSVPLGGAFMRAAVPLRTYIVTLKKDRKETLTVERMTFCFLHLVGAGLLEPRSPSAAQLGQYAPTAAGGALSVPIPAIVEGRVPQRAKLALRLRPFEFARLDIRGVAAQWGAQKKDMVAPARAILQHWRECVLALDTRCERFGGIPSVIMTETVMDAIAQARPFSSAQVNDVASYRAFIERVCASYKAPLKADGVEDISINELVSALHAHFF